MERFSTSYCPYFDYVKEIVSEINIDYFNDNKKHISVIANEKI